jgi:hypothetical protein
MNKKIKYGFGLSDTECFGDMFDTVEELLAFAQDAYENPDGNYWDEDMEDYTPLIYVGTIERHKPSDFAPSIEDIAGEIADSFYCQHNIDDNEDVLISDKIEAKKEWDDFVNKFFSLPCQYTTSWFGIYDLEKHEWAKTWGVKL